jgi:hypothetical protein
MLNMDKIVLLDLEASGLHATSFPTEVAWVTADLSAGYSAAIRPVSGWTAKDWSPDAEAVHGLDFGKLTAHGETVESVALALNSALAGATILTDCAYMDGFWARQIFTAAGIEPAFPLAPVNVVWSLAQPLFAVWRAIRRALKGIGLQALYDLDRVVVGMLNDQGGGIALFEAHSALTAELAAEAGLVAHRALDDVLAHALAIHAVEILGLPEGERSTKAAEVMAKAIALKHQIWAEEARRVGSEKRRPRADVERSV